MQYNAYLLLLRFRDIPREFLSEGAKKDFRVDFFGLALHGKQMGFAKVIKMIDDMVAVLKKEQEDDDHKKEYCAMQPDLSDDKKKAMTRALTGAETAIESAEQGLATLQEAQANPI